MSKSGVLELAPSQAVACCSPLARQPMTSDQAGQVAPMLKALATRSGCGLVTSVGSPGSVNDDQVSASW
jgi:ArsR family transcriptional regulator